jgi:hypothetical protein
MKIYFLAMNYNWNKGGGGPQYHAVKAYTQKEAIEKFIRDTTIPSSKVKVWRGRGIPRHVNGLSDKDRKYLEYGMGV